jgi:hypothetical protein
MFAGRGSYGWSGSWEADMHLVLQWAGLQPRIVYEETVQRDGLDGIRVLVMPYCDVLPESVTRRILDFQKRGGIIVADETLAPRIIPDIVVRSYRRRGIPDQDKAELLKLAAALRRDLRPFYTPYGDSSNPEVIIRFRKYGDADYLFALNDKRTYGDYVGQHRKVMEKGLPNNATLTVRARRRFVYDLLRHSPVPVRYANSATRFDAAFGPGGGTLFLITPRPIRKVRCELRKRAVPRGAHQELTVTVLDDHGAPLNAVVPVQVTIRDADGAPAEFSGYYGVRDGRLRVSLDIAPNDPTGRWSVYVRELAADRTAETAFTVTP